LAFGATSLSRGATSRPVSQWSSQSVVEHDDSRLGRPRHLERILGAGGQDSNGEAVIFGEDGFDKELNIGVILDDNENSHGCGTSAEGRRTTKHEPLGTLGS